VGGIICSDFISSIILSINIIAQPAGFMIQDGNDTGERREIKGGIDLLWAG